MSSDNPASETPVVSAGQPLPGTRTVEHPELGPATAILDNRLRTKRDLWLSLASLGAGLLGVYYGVSDAQAGDGTAFFWTFCGLILVAYGVAALRSVAVRFVKPVRFVFGDTGFDFPGRPGIGVFRWDELSAAELEIPAKQTRVEGICFQIRSPEAFAARHQLSPRATRRLVEGDGWLAVRGETAIPLEEVVAMMDERIAAAKPATHGSAAAEKRRPKRTSRH